MTDFAGYWPQIALLMLTAASLTANAALHGQQKPVHFGHRAAGSAILLGLLWAGGFFS